MVVLAPRVGPIQLDTPVFNDLSISQEDVVHICHVSFGLFHLKVHGG